jgi:hypothetical protein
VREPEETAIAMQQLDKHVPAAANINATIEVPLDELFSIRSLPTTINL